MCTLPRNNYNILDGVLPLSMYLANLLDSHSIAFLFCFFLFGKMKSDYTFSSLPLYVLKIKICICSSIYTHTYINTIKNKQTNTTTTTTEETKSSVVSPEWSKCSIILEHTSLQKGLAVFYYIGTHHSPEKLLKFRPTSLSISQDI